MPWMNTLCKQMRVFFFSSWEWKEREKEKKSVIFILLEWRKSNTNTHLLIIQHVDDSESVELQDARGILFRARDCNNVSRHWLWNLSKLRRIRMKNLQYAHGRTHKIAKCSTKFHAKVVGRMGLFEKNSWKQRPAHE